MRKGSKIIVGAALGLLLGGLLFVWRDSSPSEPIPALERDPARAIDGLSPPKTLENSSNPALSERHDATPDAAADSSANSANTDERLRGRVTDVAGAAVVGAQVDVVHASADSFNTLDPSFARQVASIASVATDALGEFSFELPRDRLFQLDVSAAGYGRTHVPHCMSGEFVEIRLQRAATLFGFVRRRADDSPVVGASVRASPRRSEGELTAIGARREAVTDGVGHYRIESLAPGRFVVDVVHAGDASPAGRGIELAAGVAQELNFTLDAGVTIRGHVTDAETGLPIAGAQIAGTWTFEAFVTSEVDGGYEFNASSEGAFELVARAHGYGRSERRARDPATGASAAVVDFALTRARRASGRIVDERAAPIAGAYVAAAACDLNSVGAGQRIDWSSVSSGADGTFELADLRSDLHHTLFVRKQGFGTVAYEFPADEGQRASIELGDIALPPSASLLGRVVDALEQPVAHQLVELHGINRDRARLSGDAQLNLFWIDLYVAARETHSDSRGLFRFDDIAPGDYALSATVGGNHEIAATLDVAIERAATLRDIVLVIDRGLSIEGIVRVSDGGALPTVYVSVDPEVAGNPADCEVAGGRFKAQGLSAATYTLTAYPYPSSEDKAAGRVFLPTKLGGIAAGTRDVVLELRSAIKVRGKVLDTNGDVVQSAQIVVRDEQGNDVDETRSLADGSFEITAPAGERFDVEAQPPHPPSEVSSQPPPDPSTFAKLVDLRGNENLLELRLNWRR